MMMAFWEALPQRHSLALALLREEVVHDHQHGLGLRGGVSASAWREQSCIVARRRRREAQLSWCWAAWRQSAAARIRQRNAARRIVRIQRRATDRVALRALLLWRSLQLAPEPPRCRERRRPACPSRRAVDFDDAQLCLLRVLRLDAVRRVDRSSTTARAFGRWVRAAIAATERARFVREAAQPSSSRSTLREDGAAAERALILAALQRQPPQAPPLLALRPAPPAVDEAARSAERAAARATDAALRTVVGAHAEALGEIDALARWRGATLSASSYAVVRRAHDALAALAKSHALANNFEWAQAARDALKVLAAVLTEAEHVDPGLLPAGTSPPAVATRGNAPVAWHALLEELL